MTTEERPSLARITVRTLVVFYGTIGFIVWACYWPWGDWWDKLYEGFFNYQYDTLAVLGLCFLAFWLGMLLSWYAGLSYYYRVTALRKGQIARLKREVSIYRKRLYPGYTGEKEQVKS
jgi:hypothetical protein